MREFEAISEESQVGPKVVSVSELSELDEVLRHGARRMLVQAVEAEAAAYVDAHRDEIDDQGRAIGGAQRLRQRTHPRQRCRNPESTRPASQRSPCR